MKNNDFLEIYGPKALEKLKKPYTLSSKTSLSFHPSIDKRSTKNSKKKPLSKSKSKININPDPNFTFNKMHPHQGGKKRLVISGLSTPKNMGMKGSNHNKYGSPSTKRKGGGERKNLVKNALESLEKISEKENRVSNWVQQFKLIILKLSQKLQENRKKYTDVSHKNKKLQKQLAQLQHKTYFPLEKHKSSLMEENFSLRNAIKDLKGQLLHHEKKQLALVEALQQAKESSQGNTMLKIEQVRNENVTEFDVECDDN